jgi:succinate-semialdehyde dehydrogenase/glutarate-semialdehyde dehydrogenase
VPLTHATLTLDDAELLRGEAYVDGRWEKSASGAGLEVRDPAGGSLLGTVPDMGGEETHAAIAAAEAAFPAWSERTAADRAALLRALGSALRAHQQDLARLMTAEQGKPLAESQGEIGYAASFLEWYAEEAKRSYGEIVPEVKPGSRILVTKEPIGVVAAITPWNFPAAMITRKLGPALAAGCTLVVKPAEDTPLSALAIAELAHRVGVPPGVLNVVTGQPEPIGEALTSSPRVRKLSFTGSSAVGRLLLSQCAPTLKRVSLELGGNAPFLVFDDADLEAALDGAMASKFRNSGQTCVCANRFLLQEGIASAFIEGLVQRVGSLVVGSGVTTGVEQGPLINGAALQKVERLLTDAVAGGARIRCGGARHALGGTFFQPTVVSEVSPEMALVREEIFGPVAPVTRFADEDEAVRLANGVPAGLAAYCYTRDLGRALRMSRRLEVGMVGINEGILSNEVAPFGGVKQSGLGREGGRLGLDEYLEVKYTLLGGIGG